MPEKCYFKPNRRRIRTFTAKDVGRIACQALQAGESRTRIRNEVNKCLRNDDEETDCDRLRSAVRNLLKVGAAIAIVLSTFIPVLRVIRTVIVIGSRIYQLLPKGTKEVLTKRLPKSEDVLTIEGEFTRILDDIRIIAREFPPENLPRP